MKPLSSMAFLTKTVQGSTKWRKPEYSSPSLEICMLISIRSEVRMASNPLTPLLSRAWASDPSP